MSADDDEPQSDPQPPTVSKFKGLPLPQLAMGAALVALNAIVAGAVFSTMNRMEGRMARQVESEAAAENVETAESGPQEDLEVEVGELPEQEAPEEVAVGQASLQAGKVAAQTGHADLSGRLMGDYLLRMDARGTTDGAIALVLADHGDLDRQTATQPPPTDAYESTEMLDERLLLELSPEADRVSVTLRARARARAILDALAERLGLTLRMSPALPADLPDHPLVIELRERPLHRVLAALSRALNVTFAQGDEFLEVMPGPRTAAARRARAMESYRWVLEDYSRSPAASRVYLSLSVLREEEDDYAGMVQALRELILTWPESRAAAVGRLRLGRALLGRETAYARRYLFELLGEPMAPIDERVTAGLLIGRSYMETRDLIGAQRSLEYSIDLAGEVAPQLAERAKAYLSLVHLEAGEHEDAVRGAKGMLNAVDDEARRVAAEVMSRAELAMGLPNRASRSAAAWVASSVPSERARALSTLARALDASGRPVSSSAIYKLIRVEGGVGSWAYVVAESGVLTRIGHWEEAQRILEHGIEQNQSTFKPDDMLALRLELARVALELNGPSKAKPILAAVALDPRTNPDLRARAYMLLARVALMRDDREEALALYTALAEDSLAPTSARAKALDRRREMLVAEGRTGSAVLAARGLLEGGAR